MPNRPKRPCKQPGCSNLVESGYCEQHRHLSRQYDKDRESAAKCGYDKRWQRYRLTYLQEHPLCECEECKKLGRSLPATVIDHKIAHKGDPVLFWDPNNHQAMAKRCHDKKTAREDGGFGNAIP